MNTNNDKGFTLIEVIVALLLIAIIGSVSAPEISRLSRNYNFSNDMRMMLATLSRARSQAIQTGINTAVAFTPNDAATQGTYVAFFDDGAVGGVAGNGIRDGGEAVIQREILHNGIILAQPNFQSNALNAGRSMTFNSLGLPWGFNGGIPVFFSGTISASMPTDSRIMNIVITTGGSLRINRI